jgi:hypothetical protein
MKNFVIGAIVGAAGAALICYFAWGRAGSGGRLLANPNAATITVTGGFGTNCTAKIDPFRIGNKKNEKVFWEVVAEAPQCASSGGNWHLELKFDNDVNGTPWNGGTITVARNGVTPYKIQNNANVGKFPYHVIFVPGSGGSNYEMLDPELEIEQ